MLVERVRRDPAAHHHHWHSGSGMRGPSRQIETLQVRTGVGGFEGPVPTAVTGDAIDRAIQYLVSLMNVERSERLLKNDAFLYVDQAGGALQFVENHLAISGEHF